MQLSTSRLRALRISEHINNSALDFHALEEMIAGTTDGHAEGNEGAAAQDSHGHDRHSSHFASRFSRYIRFARGRQGSHNPHRRWGDRDNTTEDPTDPPYPIIHDTSL